MIDTVALTQRLIEIQSTSDNLDKLYQIVEFCLQIFKNTPNADIKIYEKNKYKSIVIQNFEGKEADYILLGHLDVVSPSEHGQFNPYIVEGKLCGRGSYDMKGTCAAMISIMHELLSDDYKNKKISLILTTDEEISGENGTGYLVKQGYKANLVIVPDGGNFQKVVIKQKGILRFKLETAGKSTHGSTPWKGNNAIENIFGFYQDIKEWIEKKDNSDKEWFSTISMNNINTPNGNINKVPDIAIANFDCRITQKILPEELEKKFVEIAKKHNGTIKITYSGNPLFTDENSLYAQKYMKLLKQRFGEECDFDVEHSGCDGNFFSAKGMNVVVHRPNGGNIHSRDERIDIKTLQQYREFLYEFITLD